MTMGLPNSELRAEREARGQAAFPLRVVVSGSGALNSELRLFGETFSPVVVYSTQRMPQEVRKALEGKAAVRLGDGEKVDVAWMLESLSREFGVKKVVFEGGGALFASFLREGCIDEVCLTLCPLIFGGREGVTLTGIPGEWLPESVSATLLKMEVIDGECFVRWSLRAVNKIAETVDSAVADS
ncbi:MAG: dihydrofolate reductase family protein, partial [Verrucomicrobiota bacterium]